MGSAASATQRTVRRGHVYVLDTVDRRKKRRLLPVQDKWVGVSSAASELRAGIVQNTVRTLPALKADTRATRKVLRHRHSRRVQAHARAQSRIKQLEALRKRLAFATAASDELEFGLRPGAEIIQACDRLDTVRPRRRRRAEPSLAHRSPIARPSLAHRSPDHLPPCYHPTTSPP